MLFVLSALVLCVWTQDLKFTSKADLQSIIYDNSSKRVFVGGTNVIIRLSDELTTNQQLATGPFPDNSGCYSGESCQIKTPTDNRNQILLISNALLIHCGTAYGGRCNASDPATLAVSSYKSSNNTNKDFWIASASETTLATANSGLNNGQGLFVAIDITYKQLSLGYGYPMISSYYMNVLEVNNLLMFQRVPNARKIFNTPVKFKSMFSDPTYFYTIGQMMLDKKPFVGRICNRDEGERVGSKKEYTSYIQAYLKCSTTDGRTKIDYNTLKQIVVAPVATNLANKMGAKTGDDILLGLFFDETTTKYAICGYVKKSIDALFDSKSSSDICNHNIGSIGQTNETSAKPLHVLKLGTTNTTDVKLFKIKDDNIAIVSLYNGSTIKVVLGPENVWTKLDLLSDKPILKLVASSTRIYGLSNRQVTGMQLGKCKSYSTCEDCVDSREPFCGWCVLKSKCTQISECRPGIEEFIPELWANNKTDGLCFPITNVIPQSARIVNSTDIQVTAKVLVQALRGRSIYCDWGKRGRPQYLSSTILSFNAETVSCKSPPNLSPDLIQPNSDSLKINITLREYEEETSFMTLVQDFPLFYCPNSKACYNCTNGRFPCKWCKETNRCRHTSEACSTGDAAPTSLQCPRLTPQTYLVESKGSGRLALEAINIPTSTENNYKCILNLGYRTLTLDATTTVNSISCNIPIEIVRAAGSPNRIPIIVTYKNVPILNPDNTVIVTLYSCSATPDCSSCKGMDVGYGCGWCTSVMKCFPSVGCEDRNLVKEDRCSDPGPTISQIIPNAGPIEGGTQILIKGTDLSIKFEDIRSVRVVGSACNVIRDDYIISKQVRCTTSAVDRPDDGAVSLDTINGQASSQSIRFYYKVPIIQTVSPTKVLVTGGTNITLSGSELTIGSNRTVVLAGMPCDLIDEGRRSPLVCRTRPVSRPDGGKIVLMIDRGNFSNDQLFTYVAVPSITEVKPFKSIQEGGINITLSGSGGFKPITSVQIVFSIKSGNISEISTCAPITSDREIRCTTPKLLPDTYVDTQGTIVNITLILEGSFSKQLEYTPLTLFPNPRVDVNVDEKISLESGQTLVIKGKFFDRVLGIKVFINEMLCLNITPADTLISCIVPEMFMDQDDDGIRRKKRAASEKTDGEDDQKAVIEKEVQIQVRLGNFKSVPFPAIYIQRVSPGDNMMATLAASIGAGVVVLLLLFAVCFLYRRKLQQKKQFKHIMLQEMERIEHRLAEECKQVFTELQTDLADLNSDFSPATIPYLSFDEYAVKVLFPGQEEHPVMQPLDENVAADFAASLNTFEKLIHREQFLITLVEVLESQRQVSKRDRSTIAALMIVSLMNNMTYTTTILKTLLSDLITQAVVNDGRRAKLLLRRTDHIAEKYLSNWLTFNLHTFLCEAAGQPLYVLYRAIKQQIEKGPVDYITGNARYALLEKNLLSKMLEFQKLNVMVYLEDDPYLRETDYTPLKSSQVALLSCDTISQAKAKIIDAMYKTVPDSLKPTPNDVDVEWKNGRSSSLRLVDMLHNTQDGWKQLDTLGTLNIDDQAVFQCIPRQSPPPFMSQNGGAPSCNSLLREIESGRVWHLERDLDCDADGKPMSGVKSVPEVFLTRLSATKIPLQKFVDDLFDVIFTPTQGIVGLPPCIKYIMDFLDKEAEKHGITDPEIIHTWKNNAIPLRYWISIIKSPDVVFDVRKNNNIDSCLSVIAQTFIDACYYEDMMIDKTSQSSRLLYCKEIPTYKQHVREYFGEIQSCMPVTEADVDSAFQQSKHQPKQLNQQSALYELYIYACRFSEELIDSLQDKSLGDLANQFLSISDSQPQIMKLFVVVLLVCVFGGEAINKETVRARLNARGTQTAENMMKSMIRKVNDLIKKYVRLDRMQLGPVTVEGFSIRSLDTAQVTILMNGNRLGLSLANGRVHLTSQLAVYIPIIFGLIRIAGPFDTYGDGIQASLSSGIGVSGGHLNANGMSCNLRVDRPRVDLHCPLINHFANMILNGVMPGVTQGVCDGVKLFGTGMANSVFHAIPTNINVFDLFRLEVPIVNFRSWNRHMVAGVGMEVRPASNEAVSNAGLRILALPEGEDSHMACVTVSDFVVNTVSRTFLPAGKSFSMDVASVLNLFGKDLFPFAIFIKGTIVDSPKFLVENGNMALSVKTKGIMTDKDGTPIAGTEIKPTEIKVSCPTNETPMFSNVVVQMTGAFNMKLTVNIGNIIDMIIDYINKASTQFGEELVQRSSDFWYKKRATTGDLTNVVNKMFFSKWFGGFSMRLQAKHGAVLVCMSGAPNGIVTNKIYGLLRSSFNKG